MKEGYIRMAELTVRIRARHDFVFRQCTDYRLDPVPDAQTVDLTVEATPEELAAETAASPEGLSAGYIESICLFRSICRKLPTQGRLFFHAAVIEDRPESGTPRGYAFAAASGTGKSTHVGLWRQAFGDRVRIINGDKPILCRRDGRWYAYGTPWCGKEGWNINTSVPLDGICLLKRGESNTIRPVGASESVTALFSQIILPEDPAAVAATLGLLDSLVREVPFYELHCTISEEAAHVARAGLMSKG